MLALALLVPAMAHAADATLANGVLLVAKPGLRDPNFSETVVLITLPAAGGGPLGVIINRPLGRRFSELMPKAAKVPEKSDRIFFGGPIARNGLLFLVRSRKPPEDSLQVLADVYLSADPRLLERLAAGLLGETRIYAGHAGWAPGQLQNEIARGGWYVIKADADTVFAADVSTIWPALIKRVTTRHARLGF